jgi:putative flavoprotein involved in K+ transport
MKLYGMLDGVDGQTIRFRQDLTQHLDAADATYLRIRKTIDDYIEREGINARKLSPMSLAGRRKAIPKRWIWKRKALAA